MYTFPNILFKFFFWLFIRVQTHDFMTDECLYTRRIISRQTRDKR